MPLHPYSPPHTSSTTAHQPHCPQASSFTLNSPRLTTPTPHLSHCAGLPACLLSTHSYRHMHERMQRCPGREGLANGWLPCWSIRALVRRWREVECRKGWIDKAGWGGVHRGKAGKEWGDHGYRRSQNACSHTAAAWQQGRAHSRCAQKGDIKGGHQSAWRVIDAIDRRRNSNDMGSESKRALVFSLQAGRSNVAPTTTTSPACYCGSTRRCSSPSAATTAWAACRCWRSSQLRRTRSSRR